MPELPEQLDIFTISWNVAGTACPNDLKSLFRARKTPHVVVIGLQEVNAKDIHEYLQDDSRRHETWSLACSRTLMEIWPSENFVLIGSQHLGPLGLLVFQSDKVPLPTILTAKVAFGAIGLLNNKGAVGLRLEYSGGGQYGSGEDNVVLTMVNAHLAPFVKGLKTRNQQYDIMTRSLVFESNSGERQPLLQSQGGLYGMFDSDLTLLMGDLNYRLDSSFSEGELLQCIQGQNWSKCLDHDQLTQAQERKIAFYPFSEASITFQPSYKYYKGKDSFDTSKRLPAWCDRILYCLPMTREKIVNVEDYNVNMYLSNSDHKPVFVEMSVKTLQLSKRAQNQYSVPLDPWWQWKRAFSKALCWFLGVSLGFFVNLWRMIRGKSRRRD